MDFSAYQLHCFKLQFDTTFFYQFFSLFTFFYVRIKYTQMNVWYISYNSYNSLFIKSNLHCVNQLTLWCILLMLTDQHFIDSFINCTNFSFLFFFFFGFSLLFSSSFEYWPLMSWFHFTMWILSSNIAD